MPSARLTQVGVEVLGIPTPTARLTQVGVEVLSAGAVPTARLTQVGIEVLSVRPPLESVITASTMTFVAEITAAINDDGDTETFYATDSRGWVNPPTGTPAHEHIAPTLKNPGTYRREAFTGNRAFGAVRGSWGEVTLLNQNGKYDPRKDHGFDGQVFTLWFGEHGAVFPDEFAIAYRCTVESASVGYDLVRLRLRDRLLVLDKPILKDTFAGTGGLEGTEEMAGTPKWRMFSDPIYTPVQPVLIDPGEVHYTSTDTRQSYDIAMSVPGIPGTAELFRFAFTRTVEFDDDLLGSVFNVATAPSDGNSLFKIYRYQGAWQTLGTVTIATGAYAGTFVMDNGVTLDADSKLVMGVGDSLIVYGDYPADSTLADMAFTIAGFVSERAITAFAADPI